MTYKLSDKNIEVLKKLPETGMGYQIIVARYKYQFKEDYFILNGQIAFNLKENLRESDKMYLQANGMSFINGLEEISLTDIALQQPSSNIVQESGKGAKDAGIENPNGDELFVRLSAFKDDFRIDKKNGCLLPGSFTTTASDALRCKVNNENPLVRYALPNELPIQWSYHIQPLPEDALQRGIAETAFARQGGGREAYFEKGTSERTFIIQNKW